MRPRAEPRGRSGRWLRKHHAAEATVEIRSMRVNSAIIALMAGTLVTLWMPVQAQVPSIAPVTPPSRTVNITEEQRHVIREIILKDLKFKEEAQNAPMTIGEVVPPGIVLHPIPVEVSAKVPQVRTHSFFVKDSHVVVVDPKNSKIADIVD
jgi:hypothetical protein